MLIIGFTERVKLISTGIRRIVLCMLEKFVAFMSCMDITNKTVKILEVPLPTRALRFKAEDYS